MSRRVALRAAADAIGVPRLTVVEQLGGSRRTSVWRVSDGDRTFVLKAYRDREGNTFAREPAALAALAGRGVAPRLLGVADEPALVVLADLGSRSAVSDALLGRDPARAGRALDGWVDAMADAHLAGDATATQRYELELGKRAPDQAVHELPETLADTVATYRTHGARLGVPLPDDAAEALLAVPAAFTEDADVLTPADMCPDNNAVLEDRVVLFDFEWAEVRHLVWDVAYLRTPWPTCWCSWRLPDAVADAAVRRYRERVSPAVPYVARPGFERDLDAATFAWCLVTPAMFLESAVGRASGNEGSDRFPGRRTLILDRLLKASRSPGPEPLVQFAGQLHAALLRTWGEHPLALAPAFR